MGVYLPSITDIGNGSAMAFNESITESLKKFCEPLFGQFPITHFSYMKIFNNGRRLFLCPNTKWVNQYITSELQNSKTHPKHRPTELGVHYGAWNSFKKDEIFDSLYDLNIWNGFTFFDRHSSYLECYHFATTIETRLDAKFYLDRLHSLSQFILYFRDKACSSISLEDPSKMIHSANPVSYEFSEVEQENEHNFMESITPSKYIFEYNDQKVRLTPREVECLLEMGKGKLNKEIASYLGLSTRTVESYINAIKKKIGSSKKSDMLKLLSQNKIITFK